MSEQPVDLSILRRFAPLEGLRRENLGALARKTVVRRLDSGRVLFKEDDADNRTFYLVVSPARFDEADLSGGDETFELTISVNSRQVADPGLLTATKGDNVLGNLTQRYEPPASAPRYPGAERRSPAPAGAPSGWRCFGCPTRDSGRRPPPSRVPSPASARGPASSRGSGRGPGDSRRRAPATGRAPACRCRP